MFQTSNPNNQTLVNVLLLPSWLFMLAGLLMILWTGGKDGTLAAKVTESVFIGIGTVLWLSALVVSRWGGPVACCGRRREPVFVFPEI